ncbi:MAG: DUF6340 family protein [Tannerellaceae bacterium]
MKYIYPVLFACLLSACSSVSYVGIETYNPAEVTFPEGTRKVLVVNNALPQPGDVGYEYKVLGVRQDTARLKADSALFDACRSMGQTLAAEPFFDDVLLYNQTTRTDDIYYNDTKLTPEQVTTLCKENDSDVLISIDRLLFEVDRTEIAFAEGYSVGAINIKMNGVVRSYLPGRAAPLATIYMADSLYWSDTAESQIMQDITSDEALRAAGSYIGKKVCPNFIPHWVQESRWYFTGMSTQWKEASAFASGEKWDKAAERWQSIYDHSTGWKSLAKSGSNLALTFELKGDLQKAYEWANQSYLLFQKNGGDEDHNTKLLKLYSEVLMERIRSDRKLNMQIGGE